jgi:hypothetical protein
MRYQSQRNGYFHVSPTENTGQNMAHFTLDVPKTTTPKMVILFYKQSIHSGTTARLFAAQTHKGQTHTTGT